jgi:hypothetical protein
MKSMKYGDWVQDNGGLVWVVVTHIIHKDLVAVERLKEDGMTDRTWIVGKHLTKLPEPICKILSDSIPLSKNDPRLPNFKEKKDVKDK